MPDDEQAVDSARSAGERAAKNTIARAIGEIVGKFASLILFVALARSVSPDDLGAYVFAFAWAQIATMPVGLGYDRYMLRLVAKERELRHELFFNVIVLKILRSIPLAAASFVAVNLLGYDEQARTAVYVLTAGLVMDTLARSVFQMFNAFERGELLGVTLVVQRILAAALGLVALALGYGVVAVAFTFTLGMAAGLAVAFWLLARRIGMPRLALPKSGRRRLSGGSLPFAAQDILGVLLSRLDAVLLSLIATQVAVGVYGSAYRLLESTFFLTSSVAGAFAAMYTYLDHDTTPTIRSVYERSMKLLLAALVPCGVVLGILAEPLARLFFGADLESVADPTRFLAPVVVLLGLVYLSTSLVVSRRDPKIMVWVTLGAVVVNVALNLALIPAYDENGAAAAMLITYALFVVVVVGIATRVVGGVNWIRMLAAPLAAGAAMAAVMLPLADVLALAAAAGVAVYALVAVAVERAVAPDDFAFVRDTVRRRLRSRAAV